MAWKNVPLTDLEKDELLKDISCLYPELISIKLVGSYARNEQRIIHKKGLKQGISDIDILIEFGPAENMNFIRNRDDMWLWKKWNYSRKSIEPVIDFLFKGSSGEHRDRIIRGLEIPEEIICNNY